MSPLTQAVAVTEVDLCNFATVKHLLCELVCMLTDTAVPLSICCGEHTSQRGHGILLAGGDGVDVRSSRRPVAAEQLGRLVGVSDNR